MPKYLLRVSYTADGAKGLLKDGGSGRRKAVEDVLAKANGKLEAFYFAFGNDDAFLIIDLPDNVTAAAISLTVAASGGLKSSSTVLLTPEEMDQAAKKHVEYRPPGR
ncbi:MAG: GYD domain-containing protein [Vulcanimicrobiaceae bacterium]